MILSLKNSRAVIAGMAKLASAAILTLALSGPASSDAPPLAPQTKLRLSVVQWAPAKGTFEQWPALGGEYVVSQTGTISLPVIGTLPVGSLDNAGLAAEVAKLLQVKIGLVNKPDVTVEVVQYPPIYVVGDVTKPGEYPFRSQMTALQALALSGGEKKPDKPDNLASERQTLLAGELQTMDRSLLSAAAKIARLQAEASGTKNPKDIVFPSQMIAGFDSELVAEVKKQETTIFVARAGELDRQAKSLDELRRLLKSEIEVLEEKNKTADGLIATAERELAAVSTLVDKGFAVASRKSDLERTIAGYRTDRLDQVTAILRARQAITEATRNLDGLYDKRQIEVASELHQERSNFDQLKLKQSASQKVLVEMLASRSAIAGGKFVTFSITRLDDGEAVQLPATEASQLRPGDVVQVILAGKVGADGSERSARSSISSPQVTVNEQSQ